MRFAVATYGTEGDTRPLAFLCRALIDAGHEARLLADAATLATAESLQVPCVPLPGDIRGVVNHDGAIAGVVKQGSLSGAAKALAQIVNRNTVAWTVATNDAAHDCDALLAGGLAGFVGLCVAEHLRVPAIGLGMIPITPTREFASPFLPPGRVPRFLNRASQALVNRMLWRAFRRETNRARQSVLGLPPRRTLWQGHPMLYGISPQLLPPPVDWPANAHICGQWVRPVASWSAPSGLQDFLDAGEPPVYLDASALPPNFHVVQDVPHDWLFARVATVVHHGGSGTSHSACRAGVPSVVVPFAGDQAFWADRLVRIGVAPRRLPGPPEPGGLRRALDEAATTRIRARAAAVGLQMRDEDGLATAVSLIEKLVGQNTAGTTP